MSDPKTVEVLSRYKADAKRAPQEYNGTHLEESPKYPSFYSGRGLEPRESASTVGFMHTQGIKDSPTESDTKFHRTSGIAMKQVENEVKNQFMKLPGFTGGLPRRHHQAELHGEPFQDEPGQARVRPVDLEHEVEHSVVPLNARKPDRLVLCNLFLSEGTTRHET